MAVALCGAAALLFLGHDARAGSTPTAHIVVIQGVAFEPESLTVQRGERVKWINKDPFPHTVTARGAFDSHSIAAGATWTYVAHKTGVYAYTCTLHPNMKGILQVQ
jgi:plastocyanin